MKNAVGQWGQWPKELDEILTTIRPQWDHVGPTQQEIA